MHYGLTSARVGKMASSVLKRTGHKKPDLGRPLRLPRDSWNQSSGSTVSGSQGLVSFKTYLTKLPTRGRRLYVDRQLCSVRAKGCGAQA